MGRNKETHQKKKAIKAAVAAKAEESKMVQDPIEGKEVEMTDPTIETPAAEVEALEPAPSTAASDGPTLPSLYEAKLNPGGGISIGEAPQGWNKNKKRARIEDDAEEKFEAVKAEDIITVKDDNAANARPKATPRERKKKGKQTRNEQEAKDAGDSAKENNGALPESGNTDIVKPATSAAQKNRQPKSLKAQDASGDGDNGRKAKRQKKHPDSDKPAAIAKPTGPQPLMKQFTEPHLYKGADHMARPWEKLPAGLCQSIESSCGGASFWEQNCVPVVLNANQSVKSGVNRIRTYLGSLRDPQMPFAMPKALQSSRVIIPVSAQGMGAQKLTSIIGLVQKAVMPIETRTGVVREEFNGLIEEWYMYISLAAHVVKEMPRKAKQKKVKKQRRGKKQKKEVEAIDSNAKDADIEMDDLEQAADIALPDSDNESEPAFEDMHPDSSEESPVALEHTFPILTVWLSRTRIPEFRDALGEQRFRVRKLKGVTLEPFLRPTFSAPVRRLKYRMSKATEDEIEAAKTDQDAPPTAPFIGFDGDEVTVEDAEGIVWKDADEVEAAKSAAGQVAARAKRIADLEAQLTSDGGVAIDTDRIKARIARLKRVQKIAEEKKIEPKITGGNPKRKPHGARKISAMEAAMEAQKNGTEKPKPTTWREPREKKEKREKKSKKGKNDEMEVDGGQEAEAEVKDAAVADDEVMDFDAVESAAVEAAARMHRRDTNEGILGEG